MFQVTIVKRFNLPRHSFFAALKVETDTGDPAVFVVRRFKPISSSSSLSSILSASSASSLPSSSSLSSLGTPPSPSSSSSSLSSSSLASLSSLSSLSSSSLSSVGPPSSSSSSSSSSLPNLFPESCDLELVTIASLSDLEQLTDIPQPTGLYRTDLIALAFKSRAQMETTLDAIIEDLRIIALLQKIPMVEFEIRTFEDEVVGDPNPDGPFIF